MGGPWKPPIASSASKSHENRVISAAEVLLPELLPAFLPELLQGHGALRLHGLCDDQTHAPLPEDYAFSAAEAAA